MGNFRRGSQGGFGSSRRSSFGRRSFGRDSEDRGFRRNSFNREDRDEFQEKFSITCDKCGKRDEVNFKPTQGKPILCRECFNAARPAPIQEQLDKINEKLDKIIASLNK